MTSLAHPLRVLLVNHYIVRSGVTKFVADLANAMAKRGHEVVILSQRPVPKVLYPLYKLGRGLHALCLPAGAGLPFPRGTESLEKMYPLDSRIKIISYSSTDKNLKLQKLRRKIKEMDPDVCVCPFSDALSLISAVTLLGSGVPYVNSEHHCPETIENIFWSRKGRLAAMSGADAIHLLLPSYLDSLPDFLRDRAVAIPNAIELPPVQANPQGSPGERKILLWLGRLHEELKQCRMALDAFALIADKFPDWDLHVAGDGQDLDLIHAHARDLAQKHALGERIKFLGDQKDVWPVLSGAQAFCFSSKTEGMPIALLEAQAAGLPCVAFAQCQCMGELVSDGQNGLLVKEMTAQALAGKLEILLADPDLRQKMGKAARDGLARFSPEAVYDAWEDLLLKTAAKKGNTEMDAFTKEPFASLARLSAMARREWLCRDFGDFFPDSLENFFRWYCWKRHVLWFQKKFLNKSL